ncbi:ribonucleoside-diphosphate reductase subunit alpha [Phragmitibacter flavus]|uniref:Ribonucleoside-diphosphate reductase n=1 Tax=Phragmitibacter flavus TaxID=2576071 RepID=A0A5R8KCV2_9BACT|nr:ribonucleoside-diphosphate reductase subunit alpha [Phragmitibacter flavus]TLD70113.1 ribonucleoside-diphosphate reductase subunit alpha [Phragmitibacter flavus]
MISRNLYNEDLALKRLATTPKDQKARFQWSDDTLAEGVAPQRPLKVKVGGEQRDFNLQEIADTIGNALADLMVARKQDDIFNEENRRQVKLFSLLVAQELNQRARKTAEQFGDSMVLLDPHEIYTAIESVLIRNNAHDVARSVMARRQYFDKMNQDYDNNPAALQVPTKVIRRNGQVVAWNPNKIEVAVRKAFLSLELDSAPAVGIAEALSSQLASDHKQFIHIEQLQDLVEEEIMRQGHFKVAKAYIQYRELRQRQREIDEPAAVEAEKAKALSEDAQQLFIVVRLNDKETILWDGLDLKKRIEFAMLGLDLNLTRDEIETELRRSIQSDITIEQLNLTVTLNAKSLMQRDADFTKFAARIHLSYIYEEVLGWDIVRDGVGQLQAFHRRAFRRNLIRGVEIERLNPKLLDYEIDKLADALDPAADLDFDYMGISTLYDRYLIVDKKVKPHRRLETPQLFWMRVAMGLFIAEENASERILALYRLYKSRRFCSSTPTLFNSGTMHSQLSSCYLYKVDDSIESIMIRGIAENAFLSKWAGGLGGSWTSVRGTGGYIKGTNGESQGVIPFLKLHNDQLVAVNQGGKRRGSGCAYLETWHNDIEDFLELRINTGDERRRTHDMNTANWIPDLFMKRMEAREQWTLFRSNDVPDLHDLYGRKFEEAYVAYEKRVEKGELYGKRVQALDLWKKMLGALFETSHPWITFKDPCNVRSPQDHAGVIHSSNLCTEITLNTSADETAVCNLGSVILENHLDDAGDIDHVKLRETIRMAVRALDNVIDINFYPTEAARNSNTKHRPIGLGVMGLQYALYAKGLPFASKEAVEFNDEAMEAIAYYAYEASSDLAAELGTYSSYKGSKWSRGLLPQDTLDLLEEERGVKVDVPRGGKMDWTPVREKIAKQGMRNSNVLAIAPTATISNIMGSSPCIEPLFSNAFAKSNLGGQFFVLNPYLIKDLKKRGLWTEEIRGQLKYHHGELNPIDEIPADLKRKYATAFAVDWAFVIESAARRQKWIDQSQSVNLWLAERDMRPMSHMYRAAWRQGLKTTYYLRTIASSNIEQADSTTAKKLSGVIAQTVAASTAGAASAAADPKEYAEFIAAARAKAQAGEDCEMCQ